jgi:hypothetical protein
MTESATKIVYVDEIMLRILESLLERDVDFTARAVARLHPSLKAASSITRSESRRTLVAQYRHRQLMIRMLLVGYCFGILRTTVMR